MDNVQYGAMLGYINYQYSFCGTYQKSVCWRYFDPLTWISRKNKHHLYSRLPNFVISLLAGR
jgi:hypothetical protein